MATKDTPTHIEHTMDENQRNQVWNEFWYRVALVLFKTTIVTFFIFAFLETLVVGFVSFYFPIEVLLYAAIVSGLLTIILHETPRMRLVHERRRKQKFSFASQLFIVTATALLAGAIIYVQIRTLGTMSYIITAVSCILVWILMYILLNGGIEREGGVTNEEEA